MLEELDIMGDPVEEAVMTLVDKEDRLRGVDEPVSCCVETPPRADLLGRAKAFRGGIVWCWLSELVREWNPIEDMERPSNSVFTVLWKGESR
jgi:hypothetical protein